MRTFVMRLALIAGAVCGAALLSTPAHAADSTFSFGPPLRPNIIFTYKCTERVRVVNRSADGSAEDSSDRTVTYFVSERQITSAGIKGGVDIRANVDSMRIEYKGLDGAISFDTQHLRGNEAIVKHREVLAPSIVVNRMVTFSLTPYGQVLKIEGPGLTEFQQELRAPGIDAFTRERATNAMSDESLTWILLPWRGLLPNGQHVKYNQAKKKAIAAILDRTVFRDTATVTLKTGEDKKPHLLISSTLDHPSSAMRTISAITDPLKVLGGTGMVTGDFLLDADGVLHSGWLASTGTITSGSGPLKVTSNVTQDNYIELIAMAPFSE